MPRRLLARRRRQPPTFRVVVFPAKLALLPLLLPAVFALMVVLGFMLPPQASGRVVGSLFDRVLDWLMGPESQEFVISGKRRRLG